MIFRILFGFFLFLNISDYTINAQVNIQKIESTKVFELIKNKDKKETTIKNLINAPITFFEFNNRNKFKGSKTLLYSQQYTFSDKILKRLVLKPNLGNQDKIEIDSLCLPYLLNKEYKLLQGVQSNFTHKEVHNQFAIDFQLPIGDTICAVYDGVVIQIQQNYTIGGPYKEYANFGNFVIIYHPKLNVFSEYYHINTNGSLVEVNQEVKQGQPIALSGNVGFSTEPHLHLNIFKLSSKLPNQRESLLFNFQNIGSAKNFKEDEYYKRLR